MQMILAYQFFEVLKFGLESDKIIAVRLVPETLESRIVDENVRGAWSIRSTLEIEVAPVQIEGVTIGIVRDRRESQVVMVYD